MKTNVIAEIGWNWMGDMSIAKKMIKAAADNGADYIKTQVFDEKFLKPGPWDTDGRRQIYQRAQPSKEQLEEMKAYCEHCGVQFMASVFSIRDAKLYKSVTTNIIKIPSFESRNIKLLKYAVTNFDKVIMSTGTSSLEEIKNILSKLSYKKLQKVILLHCVSSYPCHPDNANLIRIHRLYHLMYDIGIISPKVGVSDHIMGVESTKVALEYNIQWIEKHFTIDRSLPGRDNKFAILPEELKNLVEYINLREVMLQDLGNEYQECETEARELQTGRFAIDES